MPSARGTRSQGALAASMARGEALGVQRQGEQGQAGRLQVGGLAGGVAPAAVGVGLRGESIQQTGSLCTEGYLNPIRANRGSPCWKCRS